MKPDADAGISVLVHPKRCLTVGSVWHILPHQTNPSTSLRSLLCALGQTQVGTVSLKH